VRRVAKNSLHASVSLSSYACLTLCTGSPLAKNMQKNSFRRDEAGLFERLSALFLRVRYDSCIIVNPLATLRPERPVKMKSHRNGCYFRSGRTVTFRLTFVLP